MSATGALAEVALLKSLSFAPGDLTAEAVAVATITRFLSHGFSVFVTPRVFEAITRAAGFDKIGALLELADNIIAAFFPTRVVPVAGAGGDRVMEMFIEVEVRGGEDREGDDCVCSASLLV